jgi:protein involved in polysaccharide export with SLBB domain
MGRSLPLFLMRVTGIVLAGLLLFALFGHARAQGAAQDDNYGLKRFPGDNYDSVPPGAGIPPPPPSQHYAPVPGASIGPNGTYSTLNGAPQGAPQNAPAPLPQAAAADGYQPVPQQPMPPLQQPQRLQPPQVVTQQQAPVQPAAPAYGYRAEQPQQPQMPNVPYGYRPMPGAPNPGAPNNVQPGPQLASATPPAPTPSAPSEYVLGPGDKLRLTVYGETDLSGEFTIDGSGYARLPLIGQTRAAGYTARQLEQVIAANLSRGYMKSPRVSVDISTYRPFYVIGAVNRPGQYPYVEHMSAMNAIALAGGFNPSAVESVIFVRHEGSNKEEEVPVDQVPLIQPGDVIKVHTTFFADVTNWLSPFSGAAAAAATAAIIQ